jgi:hypothetical protein
VVYATVVATEAFPVLTMDEMRTAKTVTILNHSNIANLKEKKLKLLTIIDAA